MCLQAIFCKLSDLERARKKSIYHRFIMVPTFIESNFEYSVDIDYGFSDLFSKTDENVFFIVNKCVSIALSPRRLYRNIRSKTPFSSTDSQ